MRKIGPADIVRWVGWALMPGALFVFLVAAVYGSTEVHSSTDTWIGLAAGTQMELEGGAPQKDIYSIYPDDHWFDQNWGSHAYYYWLYKNYGRNALLLGTWVSAAMIFVICAWATFLRTESMLAALVAGAICGLGCRDFVSARPATIGFLMMATLVALLSALISQRPGRPRWWPIVLLTPLLVAWSHSHGSFIFGFGLVAVFVGCWFATKLLSANPAGRLKINGQPIPLLESLFPPQNTIANMFFVGGALAVIAIVLMWIVGRAPFAPIAVAAIAIGMWLGSQNGTRQTNGQILGIMIATFLAFLIVLIFGPYGVENFTHVSVIMGSEAFRGVNEWRPPWQDMFKPRTVQPFPPTDAFWISLFVAMGLFVLAGVVASARQMFPDKFKAESDPATESTVLRTAMFDAAVVGIALTMTFFARRFAPLFFVMALPTMITWLMLLVGRLPDLIAGSVRMAVLLTCVTFGYVLWGRTQEMLDNSLVKQIVGREDLDLLARATAFGGVPQEGLEYLQLNDLRARLFTEWTHAGAAMFVCPNVQVFIDGRAQQVYTVPQYQSYVYMITQGGPIAQRMGILDAAKIDTAMLLPNMRYADLIGALDSSPEWVFLPIGGRTRLYMRRGSDVLEDLGRKFRAGEEKTPYLAPALRNQGLRQLFEANLLINTGGGSECDEVLPRLKRAIASGEPIAMVFGSAPAAACFVRNGDIETGLRFFGRQMQRTDQRIQAVRNNFQKQVNPHPRMQQAFQQQLQVLAQGRQALANGIRLLQAQQQAPD
ncbi:MAG: hypothetical protein KDA32_06490 [Phycisphaerales bacterium]|nr:hypothetical protein [Phycisphaerales bacterium]